MIGQWYVVELIERVRSDPGDDWEKEKDRQPYKYFIFIVGPDQEQETRSIFWTRIVDNELILVVKTGPARTVDFVGRWRSVGRRFVKDIVDLLYWIWRETE